MDYLFLTENLTTPIGKLGNLTDGKHFCHNLPIISWDIPLPLLEDGSYMFCRLQYF